MRCADLLKDRRVQDRRLPRRLVVSEFVAYVLPGHELGEVVLQQVVVLDRHKQAGRRQRRLVEVDRVVGADLEAVEHARDGVRRRGQDRLQVVHGVAQQAADDPIDDLRDAHEQFFVQRRHLVVDVDVPNFVALLVTAGNTRETFVGYFHNITRILHTCTCIHLCKCIHSFITSHVFYIHVRAYIYVSAYIVSSHHTYFTYMYVHTIM